MIRILARRSRAKIPMARPNEPDMLPSVPEKVGLDIYGIQIRARAKTQPVIFLSYRDQSGILVIWRVNCEKNSALILLSFFSAVIFLILLFGVSFSESWKSNLGEKFRKSGSILKQKSFSAVRKRTCERLPV